MDCFLYQVLQDFLAQTEARLVRGSSTGHMATSLVCVRTEFSNADLVGVTGDVLCEPERFGGQVFMCGSGRSGECFHVCTCEGTFHRVILGLRFCAFFKTGSLLCLLSQYYGFSFWGSGFWRCALCIYLVLWKVLGKL